ncbi:MAG: SelB C-terminal domain-containing protein [Candidatus Aminicenantales bacterium]
MKTSCFDAVVDFFPRKKGEDIKAALLFKKHKISASFSFYRAIRTHEKEEYLVRISTPRPLSLQWKDEFLVQEAKGSGLLGKGRVLDPHSGKVRGKRISRRVAFLQKLMGEEIEMLAALVQERGIKGMKEKEMTHFASLGRDKFLSLSQKLEAEGKVWILSFSPLFLLSKRSLDFLCQKILAYLSSYHEKHPGDHGVSWANLKKRFGVESKILSLAIHRLSKENRIKHTAGFVALPGFERVLSPQEQLILDRMEKMCLEGELRSVSFEEFGKALGLTPPKLNRLVSILVERERIVQGSEGYFIHSQWLDELISRIRDSGKDELTVAEFKKMTGLSRRYAIPLLELLDQLGVTRRKGPLREIIK